MFAMCRLSRGLNGFGDLEILRLPKRGDSDIDENCLSTQRLILPSVVFENWQHTSPFIFAGLLLK